MSPTSPSAWRSPDVASVIVNGNGRRGEPGDGVTVASIDVVVPSASACDNGTAKPPSASNEDAAANPMTEPPSVLPSKRSAALKRCSPKASRRAAMA